MESQHIRIHSSKRSRTAFSFRIFLRSDSRTLTNSATSALTELIIQPNSLRGKLFYPIARELSQTDLWNQLRQHELQDEKTIVFCVNDTHAAVMAAELRKLAGDEDFAARIVRSERNSHQLERRFAEIGRNKPRVAVTVDLLTTGFDAPDVKNVVFARPVKSALLYKQMKGRGTRLCEDIDKRFFTIWDYAGATLLEDAEFDGHPANIQKAIKKRKSRPKARVPERKTG